MLLANLEWKQNSTHVYVAIVDTPDGIAVFNFDALRKVYGVALYPAGSHSTHWRGLDALSAQCVLYEVVGDVVG